MFILYINENLQFTHSNLHKNDTVGDCIIYYSESKTILKISQTKIVCGVNIAIMSCRGMAVLYCNVMYAQ